MTKVCVCFLLSGYTITDPFCSKGEGTTKSYEGKIGTLIPELVFRSKASEVCVALLSMLTDSTAIFVRSIGWVFHDVIRC
jgi:hypothetical protein